MQWSQPDQILVDRDLVALKIFSWLYSNAQIGFVAGLDYWWGFSSHWVGPPVGEPICDMDVWPSPVILV
jgi:hypothetical protein